MKYFIYMVIIIGVLGFGIWWTWYKWHDCVRVGHTQTYCWLDMGK